MNQFITWQKQDLLLAINVQPRSSKNEIISTENAPIKIRITSPPTDNEANNHLIKFIAKEFGVTQSQVTIDKGLRSRKKLLRINNPRQFPIALKYIDELKQ